jgi:hypothetical protein
MLVAPSRRVSVVFTSTKGRESSTMDDRLAHVRALVAERYGLVGEDARVEEKAADASSLTVSLWLS